MTPSFFRTIVVVLAALAVASCDSPAAPSDRGTIAVFDVAGERYRARLAGAALAAARAALAGGPAVRIPNGRLAAGTDVNTGYSWHVVEVEFADATIELCDGRPSDVQREGIGYAGGRYCPWGARLVDLVER